MLTGRKQHTGGRTKHPAWEETYEIRVLGEKVMRCKYCRKDVGKKVERVLKHLENCKEKKQADEVIEMEGSPATSMSSCSVAISAIQTQSSDLVPSTSSDAGNASPQSDFIRKRPPSKLMKMDSFVTTTDASTKEKLDAQIAKAFFSCRIPFNAAENEEFRKMVTMLRPGYEAPRRKELAGQLLDKEYEAYETNLKSLMSGQLVTVSQDGWSNLRNDPIIATAIHTGGKCFPLDQTDVGSVTKSSDFLFDLAKTSILDAEEKYGAKVVGFVSDNENKMLLLRNLLQTWRPSLVLVGCSAHFLNAVQSKATPHEILEQIVVVQKAFRNVHKLHGMLQEKGGLRPQLPVETRWQSHEAVLYTFVRNYTAYVSIWEELDEINAVPKQLPKRALESRFVYNEAKHMLSQLKRITQMLNRFQAETTTLSECLSGWMELENDQELSEELRSAVKDQAKQAITPWHIVAYLADFTQVQSLPLPLEEKGRAFLNDLNPQFGAALVCFDLRDTETFPKSLMDENVMRKLGPTRFWRQMNSYGDRLQNIPLGFGELMEALQTIPCSSAGLERIFSSYSLVHTKLRNRLSNPRVEKLVKIYRSLDKRDDVEALGLDFNDADI